MMPADLAPHEMLLHRLAEKDQRRTLSVACGIDFSSNDYLGLAGSDRLRRGAIRALENGVPIGAGGSRLLRGNHPEHEALELEAGAFFKADRMLYFGSGYLANLAVLATLPQRGDVVVHDALVHASTLAGITASKATALPVAHNDPDGFDTAITQWRQSGGKGQVWIAVESLYSMDGDRAPLPALAALADHHGGFLIIDEAHATGVHGPDGRGLAAALEGRANVVTVHTCGKALGCSGALVGANDVLCDILINRAKPFIYATAPSPLAAATVRDALRILTTEPERPTQLRELIHFANDRLTQCPGIACSGSQILPVVIGDAGRTLRIAAHMQRHGFDIRAIRPPTVPRGTARLRLSITLNVNITEIADMIDCLSGVMRKEMP
ncbi:MAG TPA: 8-amino-7-oxononanoate synthase [Terriglobales bacterium]|nr:8-amino-7-oxononanoate synthase [Terriglobales bacterium]